MNKPSSLTAEQERVLRALSTKKLAHKQKGGPALTDEEQAWMFEAVTAKANNLILDIPFPGEEDDVETPTSQAGDPTASSGDASSNADTTQPTPGSDGVHTETAVPEAAGFEGNSEGQDLPGFATTSPAGVGMDDLVRSDVEGSFDYADDVQEPEAEQIVEGSRQGLVMAAKDQGIYNDIVQAMQEHDSVVLNAIDGKVFAVRPMYYDEYEILEMDVSPIIKHKLIAEACTVAGLDQLVGKRARVGVYTSIYQVIWSISHTDIDVPYEVPFQ